MTRTCVSAALQEQFHTADAPRRAAVVQRSDAIDGSSVHLDTQTAAGHKHTRRPHRCKDAADTHVSSSIQ